MAKNLKYSKIYWIENLQNIFINGFIYSNFLKENNNENYYILEINYKKTKEINKQYHNISDINKIYFNDENSLNNFKATTFINLPIYENLLTVNSLIFETDIEKEKKITYKKELINKFKNHKFNWININLKLGLFSTIYYYYNQEKNNIVNVTWLFEIFKDAKLENNYEKIRSFYLKSFSNTWLNNEELKNYKNKYNFYENWLIFKIISDFLNNKNFEKRLYDDRNENYLSIFSKILIEINNKKRNKEENYEYYINNILENLKLNFYEKWYLKWIKSKKILDQNLSLLEYLLIIILKWNYNLVLNNLEKFQIKKENIENIKLICYILKWIFEWYSDLEKEIKFLAYEWKIFDLILNKTTKKLDFKENKIKYWNLLFKIS